MLTNICAKFPSYSDLSSFHIGNTCVRQGAGLRQLKGVRFAGSQQQCPPSERAMNFTNHRYFWLAALIAATVVAGCTRDPNVLKQKHFAKGESYFQRGQYREAAIEFQNAIQIDSKYAEAHYELAQTYLKEADWLHAYQELMKTVEINPNSLKAQLDLADLSLAAGKIPDARSHAEIALQSEPQNAQAQTIISRADAAQGGSREGRH